MTVLKAIGHYIIKQILAVSLCLMTLVGTLLGMVLAALFVAIFGIGLAFIFLVAPLIKIEVKEKWSDLAKELDKMAAKAKAANVTEFPKKGA